MARGLRELAPLGVLQVLGDLLHARGRVHAELAQDVRASVAHLEKHGERVSKTLFDAMQGVYSVTYEDTFSVDLRKRRHSCPPAAPFAWSSVAIHVRHTRCAQSLAAALRQIHLRPRCRAMDGG